MYKNVEIDWCRDHGIWIDNTDLDDFLNNTHLGRSSLRGVRLRR